MYIFLGLHHAPHPAVFDVQPPASKDARRAVLNLVSQLTGKKTSTFPTQSPPWYTEDMGFSVPWNTLCQKVKKSRLSTAESAAILGAVQRVRSQVQQAQAASLTHTRAHSAYSLVLAPARNEEAAGNTTTPRHEQNHNHSHSFIDPQGDLASLHDKACG